MVLETYVKGVRRDILRQLQRLRRKRVRNNLSPLERQALRTLRRRQDIVIKPADKGSAVVVLKKSDYLKEAERQLRNKDHYQKIEKDPTPFYTAEIRKVVAKMYMNGAIDKKVKNFLSPSSPRISRLYLLPKLHKPGIPGRPRVSSCGSPTENISRFVDHFLQPLTRDLPSYIRDTTDFLQKLRELPALSSESLLVTLDVSSLYTNIPHDEGINACEEFLNTRTDQSPPHQGFMPADTTNP